MGKLSSLILNGGQVNKKLERIAFQIIEEYHSEKELFIFGISNNGFLLAKKLKVLIEKSNLIFQVKLIELKINKKQPLKSKVVLKNLQLEQRTDFALYVQKFVDVFFLTQINF